MTRYATIAATAALLSLFFANASAAPIPSMPGGDRLTANVPQIFVRTQATENAAAIDLADVQRALLTLGYDPGPIDGAMGPSTSRAIRNFQKDSGQEETGEVTPELVAQLETALEASDSEPASETAEAPPATENAIPDEELTFEVTDDPASYDLGDLSDLNTFD